VHLEDGGRTEGGGGEREMGARIREQRTTGSKSEGRAWALSACRQAGWQLATHQRPGVAPQLLAPRWAV
jgi:hypothetical protein